MAVTDAGKNVMLNQFGTVAVFASLHTADPGLTGANEVAGGSPAYARIAATWNAAAAGDLNLSNQPLFNVPASTTVAYIGLWSAVSAGTFYAGGQLVSSETFTGQGDFTLTDADVILT